jgi:hypothetical protein
MRLGRMDGGGPWSVMQTVQYHRYLVLQSDHGASTQTLRCRLLTWHNVIA